MSSPLFLSSYVLYKSALTAFLDTPENERSELSERDVMRAYTHATAELAKSDEIEFIEFAQRVLLLPREARTAAAERAHLQSRLDRAIVVAGGRLVDNGSLIRDSEFLRRTGMEKNALAEKLASHEIFEMPQEVHYLNGDSYIPAFFADRRFDAKVLYAVSRSLKACNGIQKFRFFTTEAEALGNRTPLELIELHEVEPVLSAVKAFRSRLRKP
ncbi:hypothetical protein [Massilia varians]|uniref:hypothetical protein n=1 Tax=Massilia varians TaxID=457921 RepID=UPI00255727A6|nr:hypothetical protein [Massilia varians]MDK6080119.1 hypothetical protein [Massilia varians]